MASLIRTHHLSTRNRPLPPSSGYPYYHHSHSHSHRSAHRQELKGQQKEQVQEYRREMQSIPAYHDPRGHISPMVTRRVGRNELLRTGSNCGGSGGGGHQGSTIDPGFNNVTATHDLQFVVQPAGRGPFAANHGNTVAGAQMYALSGTGTSPSITSTYEFSSGVNSGSSASAIPDSVNITASSNKIRIPVSAVKALPSSSSSPGSPSGQSSSSHVFKPTSATTSSSGRDRGVIRTTLSSASTSTTGGGSQGRRKASPGKTTQQQQQQQHQQQQPKDRQSFHATLIDLFARDKKSLLCPKCHQEGNIHRDGISEGKMRFTCNTMVPAATAASVGKRRKCNKHFYERAIHTMLIEVVRRQHGALAVVGGISMAAEASDLEGGFCTDMSSASPEITPWHHPLLAGGSAF